MAINMEGAMDNNELLESLRKYRLEAEKELPCSCDARKSAYHRRLILALTECIGIALTDWTDWPVEFPPVSQSPQLIDSTGNPYYG